MRAESIELLGRTRFFGNMQNGGQLWSDAVAAGVSDSGTIPSAFCDFAPFGFDSRSTAFMLPLLVDIIFQIPVFSLNSSSDSYTHCRQVGSQPRRSPKAITRFARRLIQSYFC